MRTVTIVVTRDENRVTEQMIAEQIAALDGVEHVHLTNVGMVVNSQRAIERLWTTAVAAQDTARNPATAAILAQRIIDVIEEER
jgi:hypothetical protein